MKKSFQKIFIAVLVLLLLPACAGGQNRKPQTTELREFQTTEIQEQRTTEIQETHTTEIQEYQTTENQEEESAQAVEVHPAEAVSRDIHLDLQVADKDDTATLRNKSLSLGVGADNTEMLVTWQGGGTDGYVEIVPVKVTELSVDEISVKEAEGASFAGATVFQAQAVYTNDWGTNTFRAVLTDLVPGQKYAYRVTDEGISETHTFTVADGGEVYSFIMHGDPQICDEDDWEVVAVYEDIINQAMDGQKPNLILSLGDQSNIADDPELFLRYLSAEPLKEAPLAVVVGNHEIDSDVFSRLFYVPNVDGDSIDSSGDMSGDYWFYRNHTLFLCLNSNNKDLESHQLFLNKAKEECLIRYGQPDWIIAAFHHSLFSAGLHAGSESILKRREAYVPMLEEVGVDVVFSGHDHTYTRSFPMDGLRPLNNSDDGIVYFCLGSPTGTKYYDLGGEEMDDYVAVTDGSRQPSVTRVDVTKSTMTVTTFIRKNDGSLNVLDSYEITK